MYSIPVKIQYQTEMSMLITEDTEGKMGIYISPQL